MVRVAALLLCLMACTDTEYAPGYSEHAWESVRVGDSERAVTSKLGTPLDVRDLGGGTEGWLYTRSPSSTHYHYREIHLRAGVVTKVDAHFYFD